jgi:hypothetical protein
VNQEWEYCVETLGSIWRGPSPEELEVMLNEAASDGWEFLTTVSMSSSNRILVVLRRSKRTRSRPRRETWP